jgi:2-methylisocitrate lyase-like PEP mutase family enzyme
MTVTIDAKRARFRELHAAGCFVIPNPWDVGSAICLEKLGFPALATTSSGFAWTQGRADGAMDVDSVLAHVRMIAEAVDVPLNVDFEAGYAPDPEGVAANVKRAVEAGASGLSIEDARGHRADPIYPVVEAVERLKAARAAIDRTGKDVLLTGRAENFLHGRADLDDTIRRLQAYAVAGADCLYAPGIRTREEISAVVAAVAPKPVNVLMGWPGWKKAELEQMGVRRISVGGALARSAWGGFMRAADRIARDGDFDGLGEAASGAELNKLFGG